MSGTVKPLPGTPLNLAHPLANGLVGCWLLNENSGNLVHDYSGQNNTGTLTGFNDPPIATSGWNAGPHGGALAFDGSNDLITANAALLPGGAANKTFVLWINPTSAANAGIMGYGGLLSSRLWDIALLSGKIGVHWYGNSVSTSFPNMIYVVGQMQQAAFAYDGAKIYSYLNGVFKDSPSITLNTTATGTFIIGNTKYTTGLTPIAGLLSALMIYNRFLLADEIAWLYHDPYCMFLDRGLYESWLKQRVASGLLSAGFTSKAPGASFTGKAPGVTWSN